MYYKYIENLDKNKSSQENDVQGEPFKENKGRFIN